MAKAKRRAVSPKRVGDLLFLIISAAASFAVVFLFDIHKSFYEWPLTLNYIFKTPYPYLVFVPLGAVLGLAVLKVLTFAVEEEEKPGRGRN